MLTGSNIPRAGFPMVKVLAGGAILFAAALATVIFFVFDPSKVAMFPPCLFHQWTGLDCPGCGAQRALHQLLHGNLVAAFRLNAMFVISLPIVAWVAPRWIWRVSRGESIPVNNRWWWIYIAAWLLFGLLRNLPLPMFAWFAP